MDKHMVAGGFLVAVALTASVMWLVQEAKFTGQPPRLVPQTQAAAPARTGAPAAPIAATPAVAGPVARAPQTQPSSPAAVQVTPHQSVSPQPPQNNIAQRRA